MPEYICKRCEDKLIVEKNMFYWRGRLFTGLVCLSCDALYDNPEDSFESCVCEGSQRPRDWKPYGKPCEGH